MTLEQFDLEFDILFNSISSNASPGLSPLEKSIFLTQAQDALVKSMYNGDYLGESFETNEQCKEYLRTLIRNESYNTSSDKLPNDLVTSHGGACFTRPLNCLFIIYENVVRDTDCPAEKFGKVVPVTFDELSKRLDNPFTGPLGNITLRLIDGDNIVLLGKDFKIYNVRYISSPSPIVLKGIEEAPEPYNKYLENGNECSLPEEYHKEVLYQAVQLAKNIWVSQ